MARRTAGERPRHLADVIDVVQCSSAPGGRPVISHWLQVRRQWRRQSHGAPEHVPPPQRNPLDVLQCYSKMTILPGFF